MLNEHDDLRDRLYQLAGLIAEEAARNADFANELRSLLIPGRSSPDAARRRNPRKPEAAGDPFQVFRREGPDSLRRWLETLTIPQLRGIVRQHRFDATRLSDKWKTQERFVQLICNQVAARDKQGEVFRHYGEFEGADVPTPAGEEHAIPSDGGASSAAG